jgi:hypothetical protein
MIEGSKILTISPCKYDMCEKKNECLRYDLYKRGHIQNVKFGLICGKLNDYKYFVAIGDSTVTKKAQFINRSNQGVNFSSPNANGYFNYFWVSDNTIILIEGFGVKNFGDEEKSFVDEYLKKYPSSL